MRIIQPSATLLRPQTLEGGITDLRHIEQMARISHRSEDKQTEDSWKRFLQSVVIERGDWSVAEHGVASVLFRVDRGVTHELVRHRHFSYTQESTRFVRYKEELEFIRPMNVSDDDPFFIKSLEVAGASYSNMLNTGSRPQEARSVLPNALASTIGVTGNFRAWRHLFLMRTTKETHPDFRRVMIPLLEEFKQRIPLLYDDIVPGARQIENMEKAA